jgi:hypothetical protein
MKNMRFFLTKLPEDRAESGGDAREPKPEMRGEA